MTNFLGTPPSSPPGFALESFDPIGGFRTKYRASADEGYKPDSMSMPAV